MLRSSHRFHGYGSLKAVYKHGKAVRGQSIQLRYLSRDANRNYRVAVVVSRKVHKSAIVRNRIRRRIYECVRKEATIAPGTDVIFTVYSDRVAEQDPIALRQQVLQLLEKTEKQ